MVLALLHTIIESIERDRHSRQINQWRDNMREWKENEFPRFKDMIMNPYKKGNKRKFNAYKKCIFNRVKGVMDEENSLMKSKVFCTARLSDFCIPGFEPDEDGEQPDDSPYNRFFKNTGFCDPEIEVFYEDSWCYINAEMTGSEIRKLILKKFKNILDSLSPSDFQYLITEQTLRPSRNAYKDFEFGWEVRAHDNSYSGKEIKFDF